MLSNTHEQKILPYELYCVWGLLMPSMSLYISDEQLNDTKHKGFNIYKDLLKLYKDYNQLLFI